MKKLYEQLDEDYLLPEALEPSGKVALREAGHIPAIHWPDGRWCFEASGFMLFHFERGLSRLNRGGSLTTYAAQLGHLVRYAHANSLRFEEFTDSHFSLFIKTLGGERDHLNPATAKRDENSVLQIGRLCLEFFVWLSSWRGDPVMVGLDGPIYAEKKKAVSRGQKGQVERTYWHHHSFPAEAPKRRRHPIGKNLIERLSDAVEGASKSMYIRRRRYIMLKLLEITGARRTEVASLTVNAVKAASRMTRPTLHVRSVKRGNRVIYRDIPISHQDVVVLMDFYKRPRAKHIKDFCGGVDSGFFLAGDKGDKLVPNTLTQEMGILRKAAQISEQACAHMFRHRYATRLIAALAQHHNAASKDEFRHKYLTDSAIKTRVRDLLGQSQLSSVDHYIDLAFNEVSRFSELLDAEAARSALDSAETTLRHIEAEIQSGATIAATTGKLLRVVAALRVDLGIRAPQAA